MPLWAIIGFFGFYYFFKMAQVFKKLEKEAKNQDLVQFINDKPDHPLVQEMYLLHHKSLITVSWIAGIILFTFFMGVL
ncbi:MAG: hypothetical protein DRQ89_00110 [Epsilonproteobacteria bacterium]|nr:MAG: hypothetical protein DRQ89_00110 [Campylobacterota bacterium]